MSVKIVMVCLGNICRSPLAEGILRSKLPIPAFTIHSAGTAHWHVGKKPDDRSIAVAKKNGIDISHQRGQQFTATFFDEYDYIFVMDQSNYEHVIELAHSSAHKQKVQLVLNELFPGENVDVPDPYYGLTNGFEQVYQMLDQACEVLAKRLIQNHPH
ncbi:MAG: Low molecular weight protein-tyrosine-phosphatase YfkJ [Bacteroidota bacterium]|jgi:protein-tyrosine phosphatase